MRIAGVLVFILSAVSAANAAVYNVPINFQKIQDAVNAAAVNPGADIIQIANGTYSAGTNGEAFPITLTSDVTLQGLGNSVVVDAAGAGPAVFSALNNDNVVLERMTMQNGAQGLKLDGSNQNVRVEDCRITGNGTGIDDVDPIQGTDLRAIDCVIDNNAGHGVSLMNESQGWFQGCRIEDNGVHGISIIWSYSNTDLYAEDCVILGNGSWGVYADNTPVDLICCTIAGNNVGGVAATFNVVNMSSCTLYANGNWAIESAAARFFIQNTIIWGHGAPAIWAHSFFPDNAELHIDCSDVQGPINTWNVDPETIVVIVDSFSADPVFCDALANDFSIDESSPCADGNHPDGASCGLIGCHDVACGAVATEDTSWSAIKALY